MHNLSMDRVQPPDVLVHYTHSAEELLSILRYGLLYTANPTGILDAISGGRTLPRHGAHMACFCEAGSPQTELMRKRFGRFALAINARAFKGLDLRKICYVDPCGDLADRLKALVARLAPPQRPPLDLTGGTDKMEALIQSIMISHAVELRGYPVRRSWLKLLDRLRYCETVDHAWEREWRLPGPASHILPMDDGLPEAEKRVSFRKMMLERLKGIEQRFRASRRLNEGDWPLLTSIVFTIRPDHVAWVEVHPAKHSWTCRKLQEAPGMFGHSLKRIEVRNISRT